ncbi:hypothetical protein [Streptosporangium sp. NPDC002721]|uniref:hypothetical protein n=1 Tax=Streptosporangium sp. NPDC002721 TaxID=3366188 RepID=UPI0036B8CECB
MLRITWDALPGRSGRRSTAEREPVKILDYVQAALADARGRVRRENETAAVLLFTTGAAAVATVVGLLNGHWSPGQLSSRAEWLWWTSGFFWLMGLLVLAAALHRRTAGLAGRALERRRFYPGGFADETPPAPDPRLGYRPEPGAAGRDAGARVDLAVLEIRRLDAVGDAKQRYIRRSVLLMTLSVVCCGLSVLIDRAL